MKRRHPLLSRAPRTPAEVDRLMRHVFGDAKWERHLAQKAAARERQQARIAATEKPKGQDHG